MPNSRPCNTYPLDRVVDTLEVRDLNDADKAVTLQLLADGTVRWDRED